VHALDEKLDAAVAFDLAQHKATRVSVWVRDLTSLQWASTDESERYAPASLLKVPIMIAYYKLAEIQPTFLSTKLTYTPSTAASDATQDFPSATDLVPGQQYTVDELINHMIIDSDNNAAALLLSHLDPAIYANTLVDLGIQIPGNMKNFDFVTVKSYGAIFRTLYNVTYLNHDYSEKALDLLTQVSFKGIADPLPPSTTVAHKFGERQILNSDGTVQTRELHDCGIIYKNAKPYTLCVMTEGTDFNSLLNVIQDLSMVAYQGM
jgi:beta-lactamase class A